MVENIYVCYFSKSVGKIEMYRYDVFTDEKMEKGLINHSNK